MPNRRGVRWSTETKVAVIGLIGVLVTAVVDNWDKLFPHPPAPVEDSTTSAEERQSAAAKPFVVTDSSVVQVLDNQVDVRVWDIDDSNDRATIELRDGAGVVARFEKLGQLGPRRSFAYRGKRYWLRLLDVNGTAMPMSVTLSIIEDL